MQLPSRTDQNLLVPMTELQIVHHQENADIVRKILAGERGPRRDIVLLNAGAALTVAGSAADLAEGMKLAARSVDSGQAAEKLTALVDLSGRLAAER